MPKDREPTPREVIEKARQSSLVRVAQELESGERAPFPPRFPDREEGDLEPGTKFGGS